MCITNIHLVKVLRIPRGHCSQSNFFWPSQSTADPPPGLTGSPSQSIFRGPKGPRTEARRASNEARRASNEARRADFLKKKTCFGGVVGVICGTFGRFLAKPMQFGALWGVVGENCCFCVYPSQFGFRSVPSPRWSPVSPFWPISQNFQPARDPGVLKR